MASLTKVANANQAVSETVAWATPNNAHSGSDADASATNAPAKNQSNTRSWGFPAVTTGEIPDGATMNSINIRIRWKSSTTGSTGALLGYQGEKGGSTVGIETTQGMNTVFQQSVYDAKLNGVTLADLRTANNVRLRVRAFRSSSNTAVTWSVDYIQLEIDYTAGEQHSGSGSLSTSATVTAAGTKQGKGAPTSPLTASLSMVSRKTSVAGAAGSLSATATFGRAGTKATSGAAGALTPAPTYAEVGRKNAATAAGAVGLTATLDAAGFAPEQHFGSGSLSATAAVTAAGRKGGRVSATLPATATPAAAGTKAGRGAAAWAGSATLAAAATTAHSGTATLALTATLNRAGRKAAAGGDAVTLAPTVTGTGTEGHGVHVQLTASAAPAGAGTKAGRGSGTLSEAATLAATGGSGEAHAGSGTLTLVAALAGVGTRAEAVRERPWYAGQHMPEITTERLRHARGAGRLAMRASLAATGVGYNDDEEALALLLAAADGAEVLL